MEAAVASMERRGAVPHAPHAGPRARADDDDAEARPLLALASAETRVDIADGRAGDAPVPTLAMELDAAPATGRKKARGWCCGGGESTVVLRAILALSLFNWLMLSVAFLSFPSPTQFEVMMDKQQDRMMARYDEKVKAKLHDNPKTALFAELMDTLFEPDAAGGGAPPPLPVHIPGVPSFKHPAGPSSASGALDDDHPILALIRDALDNGPDLAAHPSRRGP